MSNQPNSNLPDPKTNGNVTYSISIGGDVSVGASVGFGSVNADQIAGNDIIVNGLNIDNQGQKFGELITDLKNLLMQAFEAGELTEDKAKELIGHLEQAKELVDTQPKPPKAPLIEKLQRVMDVIDDALDSFNESKHPAALLIKALPIAALLLKLAAQIFP